MLTPRIQDIDDNDITDTNISDFLKKVRFVVDDRKPSTALHK